MTNPTQPDQNPALVKRLEAAGLYDVLMGLHEQKHDPHNCFCTTAVSGPYRKVLTIIKPEIQNGFMNNLDHLGASTPKLTEKNFGDPVDQSLESEE